MATDILSKGALLLQDVLLLGAIKLNEFVLRSARSCRSPLGRAVLREFLRSDHRIRRQLIDKYGTPLFGDVHPKNVFNFRKYWFLGKLGTEDIVLDLACGSGQLLRALAPGIKRGIGIEILDQSLAVCRRTCSEVPNLEFRKGDILAEDYASLCRELGVSAVIISHILEHIEEPVAFLKKIAAKRLLICVPSQENWLCALRQHFGLEYFTDPTHFREYSIPELSDHLISAGYRIHEIGYNSEGEIVCEAHF